MHSFKTQVLLLHSEQSTLDRFSASLGDAYSVHLATSGTEALHTLGLTPIHVMVSAQQLPGMSGIEALREARKRSPETLGILIAPEGMSGAEAEALVGKEELFQVIRGVGTPQEMRSIIDEALDQLRMNTLRDSANDRSAGLRPRISPTPPPTLSRETVSARTPQATAESGRRPPSPAATGAPLTELVVLSKDEVFLDTIRQALAARQPVHTVDDLREAAKIIKDAPSAVLVTDAAVAPRDVEAITTRLRGYQPRLVTIVAGRRDDGDQLMDLINAGMVYRFLLKPISPGRARLAIEAAIRRAREEAPPAAPSVPSAPPPAPPPSDGPTVADFEGAEEVVLSEEVSAPVVPLRSVTQKPESSPQDTREKKSGGTARQTPAQGPRKASASKTEPEKARPGALRRAASFAGLAALLTAVAAGGLWYVTRSADDTAPAPAAAQEAPAEESRPARAEPPPPPPVNRDLQRARAAVAEGRLLAPGERGALALYASAVEDAPADQELAAEVDQVVAEAVAAVVGAIEAGRPGEARAARSVIGASFPAAPGLQEVDVRLAEAERDRLLERADEFAAAGDTGGAMEVLDQADALLPGRSPAVEARRESILAMSDERGRTLLLELGNQRLLQGQLVGPTTDNARYYFRAVLAQDSESIAGRQGMAFLRTALITRIRESLEAGDRRTAERWLEEARVTGVEEQRLTPFRQAALRLPLAPPDPASASATTTAATEQPDPAATGSGEPVESAGAGEAAEDGREAAEAENGRSAESAGAGEDVAAGVDGGTAEAAETAEVGEAMETSESANSPDQPRPGEVTEPVRSAEITESTGTAATDGPEPEAAPAIAGETLADETASDETLSDDPEPPATPETNLDRAVEATAESEAEPDPATVPAAAGSGDSTEAVEPEAAAAETTRPAADPAETNRQEAAPPVRPERLTYVAPSYPRTAETRGTEGWVDIEFSLSPSGQPENIVVTDAEPAGTFDEAAMKAVGQWRYQPPAAVDWPRDRQIRIRIQFDAGP